MGRSDWERRLRHEGYGSARFLADGAEGIVFALGNETIAKVWKTRTEDELQRLQRFYEEVACGGLPYATPRILRLKQLAGRCVSIERELPGEPLCADRPGISPDLSEAAVSCLVKVMSALAGTTTTPPLFELPVLDERSSPWSPQTPFTAGLGDLVGRRVARFHGVLGGALPNIDEIRAATVHALSTIGPTPTGLVHGDLIPANVLTDGSAQPTAVLDFGFFSTVGDPAFEASVTASICDMYGAQARATEAMLDGAFLERFGYDPRHFAIYRAAYALSTSNAFGSDGRDGHFTWCVQMLKRPDVLTAIDLA